MTKVILIIFTILTACYTEGVSQNKTQAKSVGQLIKPVSKTSTNNAAKIAVIKFDHEKIDFGNIKENAIIEKVFTFTNIGNADLVIIDADASCGCTMPIVPKEPIKPGEKSQIVVKYTAKGKVGPQKPLITITTNGTPSIVHLQLEGWVDQILGGGKD